MSLQTRIESLVQRLAVEFKTIYGQVGTLANLSTTDKTNLVAAINELKTALDSGDGSGVIDDTQPDSTSTTFSAVKIHELLDTLKANLLGGAEAAYDTLKELQDALLNDASGVAALLAAIGDPATDFVPLFESALVP